MASLYFHPPSSVPLEAELLHDASSDFSHSFGGAARHEGVVPSGCSRPLHLLYTIDLADPNCRLSHPIARHLPLYYGFQYDATPVWYRVVSDSAIEIVRQDKAEWTDDFPYLGFPASFPELPVRVMDPHAVTDRLTDQYISEQWAADKDSIKENGREPDGNDLIGCAAELWQGAPRDHCINFACAACDLSILAVIEHDAVDGVHFWDEHGEGEEVQLLFQICPKCSLIFATNQCT
jgi:hypothetical protein